SDTSGAMDEPYHGLAWSLPAKHNGRSVPPLANATRALPRNTYYRPANSEGGSSRYILKA
ncbi:MAG TPA: hypothetical protein PLN52_26535, partial [Opitutaceae bacterium]|nr:hypothetical protein [Opitutaceae bacterium]